LGHELFRTLQVLADAENSLDVCEDPLIR
jgi:hypothetical protein